MLAVCLCVAGMRCVVRVTAGVVAFGVSYVGDVCSVCGCVVYAVGGCVSVDVVVVVVAYGNVVAAVGIAVGVSVVVVGVYESCSRGVVNVNLCYVGGVGVDGDDVGCVAGVGGGVAGVVGYDVVGFVVVVGCVVIAVVIVMLWFGVVIVATVRIVSIFIVVVVCDVVVVVYACVV